MSFIPVSRTMCTNDRCIHCLIHRGITRWADKHCPQNEDGLPIIDISEVIGRICEVVADMVGELPDGPKRQQWEKFSRSCLDAAFESKRTGHPVKVESGEPEGLH